MSTVEACQRRINRIEAGRASLQERVDDIEILSADLRSLWADLRNSRLALAEIELETHRVLAWLIAEHHHLYVPAHQDEAERNEWFAWFGQQSSYPPKLTAEWLTWLQTPPAVPE